MNGIVVLDKPQGITSFSAVRAVRRLFGEDKAGHTGTLDPMATGVLPIMLGRATKLCTLLPDDTKAYIATAKLGALTDTGDAEGTVIKCGGSIPTREELEAALISFLGDSEQLPPMYSAIKQNGKPLYELARQGKTVQRKSRSITIHSMELLDFDGESFSFSCSCSSGTYIRTLAEDAAAKCGALCHLTALRRTVGCGFSVENAVTLDQLTHLVQSGQGSEAVISPEAPFMGLEKIELSCDTLRLFMNGFLFPAKRVGQTGKNKRLRVYVEGRFAALAEIDSQGTLKKIWQDSV